MTQEKIMYKDLKGQEEEEAYQRKEPEEKAKEAYQEISDNEEEELLVAPVPEIIIDKEEFKKSEEKPEQKVPEAPPPVTFSEEELNEAKSISYQEGYEKGKTEANESIEKQIEQTLINIQKSLQTLNQEYDKVVLNMKKGTIDVALHICKKVLPNMMSDNAFDDVAKMIDDAIDFIKDETRVEIRVNQAIFEQIKEKIEKIKQELNITGNIIVISDINIKISDCKISFNNGVFEKNTDDVFKKVGEIIENYKTAIDKNTV
ncbi:MAG: flagellar assembly protein H [Alphaproteobacteria bacterium ADurb.Bin438]|nr:MAG: flagellar assembly protein H [Alphaproteobacteria bacterium ADurb.Bin438]